MIFQILTLWSIRAASLLSCFGGLPVGSVIIQWLLLAEPSPDHIPSPSSWGSSPAFQPELPLPDLAERWPWASASLSLPTAGNLPAPLKAFFQMPPPTGSLPCSHNMDMLGQMDWALRASSCPPLSTRSRLMAGSPGHCPRISPRARMMSSPWVSAPLGWLSFLLTAHAQ